MIGPSGPRLLALVAAKRPVPTMVQIRALIDTGATCTCVDPSVLKQIGSTPTGKALVHTPTTAGVPQQVDQHDISLAIPGATPSTPPLAVPTLAVTEHVLAVQGIQALIGRDVLSACLLTYNGSMNLVTLCY